MADQAEQGRKPIQRRAHDGATGRTLPRSALNDSPAVQLLYATSAVLNGARGAGAGVVQRMVMHKISNGVTTYYSSLEENKPPHATFREAEDVDKMLSAVPDNIDHALNMDSGRPRRAPTPYSYGGENSTSAAPNYRDQGPHSLGFAATDYRLGKRLAKGQHQELWDQVLDPVAFANLAGSEPNGPTYSTDQRQRMLLDYNSIHNRFTELYQSGPHGPKSEFHLVTKHLMQMHPHTSYGDNLKSAHRNEKTNSRFGTASIDSGAEDHVTNKADYENYLHLRRDIFHSSDTESDRDNIDYKDHEFSTITPAPRRRRTGPAHVAPMPIIGAPPVTATTTPLIAPLLPVALTPGGGGTPARGPLVKRKKLDTRTVKKPPRKKRRGNDSDNSDEDPDYHG